MTTISEPIEGSEFYGLNVTYQGSQPAYTDSGNGTGTDNVTGLIWQQTLEGKCLFHIEAVIMQNIL